MSTAKKKALIGAGSALGLSIAAWRTLFPWIGYDITFMRAARKIGQKLNADIANGLFLIDLFENTAKANPKKPFIIFEDRIYTYEFVNEQACKVANIALKVGLKFGDTAAILITNEPAFIWTFIGLQKIGVTVAFLNTNNRHQPLLHSIKVSEAEILIVGQEIDLFHAVEEIRREITIPVYLMGSERRDVSDEYHSWDQLMFMAPSAEICRTMRAELNHMMPCCYIYTSGTTGLPKPAILKQVRTLGMSNMFQLLSIVPDDVIYTVTPLYHTIAQAAVFSTMAKGATVVLKRKFSAKDFLDDCRRYNVTIIQYIGELCRYLLAVPESPRDSDHKIRAAIGNGLRKDIWEKFQKRFNIQNICEFYGATEGAAALFNVSGKVGAIGRLSPIFKRMSPGGIEIIKFDPTTEGPYRDKNNRCVPVEIGEPGLFVAGIPPTYADRKFYKGSKEMNEKKIITNVFKDGDSFFNLGDLVYYDKDYFVYFHDRVGDTFRWKGENVSTNEVANVLTGLEFIHDANVYGVQVPGHDGRAGMAALHLVDNTELSPQKLKNIYDHCLDNLPGYARPLFLRLEESTRITATFKQHKVDLVKEGFDPRIISDSLYYLSQETKTYLPFDSNSYGNFLKSRL